MTRPRKTTSTAARQNKYDCDSEMKSTPIEDILSPEDDDGHSSQDHDEILPDEGRSNTRKQPRFRRANRPTCFEQEFGDEYEPKRTTQRYSSPDTIQQNSTLWTVIK